MDVKLNVSGGPFEGNLAVTECSVLLEGSKKHVMGSKYQCQVTINHDGNMSATYNGDIFVIGVKGPYVKILLYIALTNCLLYSHQKA